MTDTECLFQLFVQFSRGEPLCDVHSDLEPATLSSKLGDRTYTCSTALYAAQIIFRQKQHIVTQHGISTVELGILVRAKTLFQTTSEPLEKPRALACA